MLSCSGLPRATFNALLSTFKPEWRRAMDALLGSVSWIFVKFYSCLAMQEAAKVTWLRFHELFATVKPEIISVNAVGKLNLANCCIWFPPCFVHINHGPTSSTPRWSQPVRVVMFGAWPWECWRREGIILDCNSAVWATMHWAAWPAVFGDCDLILPTPMTIQNGKEGMLLLLLLLLLLLRLLQRGGSGVLLLYIQHLDPQHELCLRSTCLYEQLAMMMMMMVIDFWRSGICVFLDCGSIQAKNELLNLALNWRVTPTAPGICLVLRLRAASVVAICPSSSTWAAFWASPYRNGGRH